MVEPILIPVSAGELLDKKTILEIKQQRISDAGQLANVKYELDLLTAISARVIGGVESPEAVRRLESDLRQINMVLWDLENAVRAHEKAGTFDQAFIETARSIYSGNDKRAAIKRQINLLLNSPIIEEKSHNQPGARPS